MRKSARKIADARREAARRWTARPRNLASADRKSSAHGQISQRRDLDDPRSSAISPRQMQNGKILSMLTLHTFADSHGHERQTLERFQRLRCSGACIKKPTTL